MQQSRRRFLTLAGTLGASVGLAARPSSCLAQAPTEKKLQPEIVVGPTGGDQTAALQKAIDAAAERGAKLVLTAGDYRVTTLQLRSGTRITGSGKSRLIPAGEPFGLLAKDAHGLVVEHLTIDGQGRSLGTSRGADGLLTVAGGRSIRIEGVTLAGSAGHGLSLQKVAGRVSGCAIVMAKRAAIFSIDAEGLEIAGNTIEDCADNGILVWRSAAGPDATLVHHNRVRRIANASGGTGEFGNGINLFRAHGVIVEGNRIEACAFSAVRANAASNALVANNSIAGAGEVALYVEFGFEGAVVSGNIIEDAADGIVVTNFDQGGRLASVQGNLVRNVTRKAPTEGAHGLGIAVEADAAVTGNVIENAPTAGIFIGFGRHQRDIAATGNVIRRAKHGIAVQAIAGAGKAVIASNLISGSEDGAIRAFDHWKAIGPDLASPGARVPPHVLIGQNQVA